MPATKLDITTAEYERGEHRKKHCWNRDEAGFVPGARGAVGKCPNTLRDEDAQALLRAGIPFYKNEDDLYPSSIYNVHRGVIFEAAPTNPGRSYHGYPWRGRREWIPESIREQLRERARTSGDEKAFDRWLKQYMQ